MHHECPECKNEDGGGGGSRKGRSRSKSRSGRRSSSRHRKEEVNESAGSAESNSLAGSKGGSKYSKSSKQKKRIRVKNLKHTDEQGKVGRYSGYVNDDHRPNGEGTIVYENGGEWEGTWSDGERVHGRMR